MGMAVGENKGVMADMNVVPLIDILLVLLIIFMVITPLTPKGLEALVPQPSPPDAQQNQDIQAKTVVVQVLATGQLKINQEDTSWDDMGRRLEEIFKTRAERVAFIKGEDDVLFREIAKAIDIMRASGIDSVGLITAKVEAGE